MRPTTACVLAQMSICANLNPLSLIPSRNAKIILSELKMYAAFFLAMRSAAGSSHDFVNLRYSSSVCSWSFSMGLCRPAAPSRPSLPSTYETPKGGSVSRRSISSVPSTRDTSSGFVASPQSSLWLPMRTSVPCFIFMCLVG